MTKIDIFSGFLGAGKTTLIKKLLKEALAGTKVVLIENEFGEIGVDGGFLQEAGIQIKEMNSGCICCSLVGDFGASLKEVLDTYKPERVLIEPSGVGKLSDVIKAVQKVDMSGKDVVLNSAVAVVDAKKCKMYMKNFGEFFLNQIEAAGTIILSRSQDMTEEKLLEVVAMIKEHNDHATIITTNWDDLKGEDILTTIESRDQMAEDLLHEVEEHHHDDDDDDDDECDDPECECHHHHHDDDDDEHEHHHHHHHHHHDDGDDEHEHHHHHHHHHHADEVFTSWGMETPAKYSKERIDEILKELDNQDKYGIILRAKGMVPSENGDWVYFDYVPEESNVRAGAPQVTGKFCVIGSKLNEHELEELFAK